MKSITKILGFICLLNVFTACESHFISDVAYRSSVEHDLMLKQQKLSAGHLFSALHQTGLDTYEREALSFLYAYMPLADIADYSADFHLMNIRAARKAISEMPWGKQIPEDIFRHFVLPVRVNNEPLDSARVVFYAALKDRVKHLSLKDAILEVNHWCHEKAIYRPSDARTSSPLATVRTAFGRCGEESTLLVAALRSVGIPARQVYTPRWAHTDDNHAWVEAWADGKWYFLGACEPEPVLNLAWFNSPASRGMLMHTKVFGRYSGQEEIMQVTPVFTEINVIANYAPTSRVEVSVVDADNQPVPKACVEFKLYNYAEFYTVAKKESDATGKAFLTAGKGDMLVWAYKDGKFGFSKVSFGKDQTLTVKLDKTPGYCASLDWDMVPPKEEVNLPVVSTAQRAENDCRLAVEDSIRSAYTATFMTEEQARAFAKAYRLDEELTVKLLLASCGNHSVLTNFMARLRSEKSKMGGFDLLQQLSAKDLRDVKLDVLLDHMLSTVRTQADLYRRYVRNPRISNETLTPYKAFFRQVITEKERKAYQADPFSLVAWVKNHIRLDQDCNLGASPISPMGVWKTQVADAHSRDIFFIAVARSMGIPARMDEVTGEVQLLTADGPVGVNLQPSNQLGEWKKVSKGKLMASYRPRKLLDNPKYYAHFTLCKLTDEGAMQLLTYDEGDGDAGDGTTWANLLKDGVSLDAGNYMLLSGTRLASGAVLARSVFFTIQPSQTTRIDLVMRESHDEVQVIGSFNSESLFSTLVDGKIDARKSLLQVCGRGYFVVGILGVDQEPTTHAVRDLAAFRTELEQWGRKLVLLVPDSFKQIQPDVFPALPSTVVYGVDTDGIAKQIIEGMNLSQKNQLPVFLIADTFNRVVFVSQGYTIGLGEQLLKVIAGL